MIAATALVALATASPIQAIAADYLRELWRASPMAASGAGYHGDGVDGQLDDLSPATRARRLATLQVLLGRVYKAEAHARTVADPGLADRADAALMESAIELELLELLEAREFSRRCDAPLDALGSVFFRAITDEGRALNQRAVEVSARLDALPRYLDQARANLELHVPAFRSAALADGAGLIELLRRQLEPAFAKSNLRSKIMTASRRAQAAIRRYLGFVRRELPHKPLGSFRWGAALYERRFRPYLQTDQQPDEVLAAANARLLELHAEMRALAAQVLGAGDGSDGDVRAALERIAGDHAPADGLLAAAQADVAAARAFIREHDLLTLPAQDNLRVIATPPFMRSAYAVAGFDGAPPLTPSGSAFYYVTPLSPGTPHARVESHLRENNRWMLDLLSVHEAMPGHYVQFEHANALEPETRRVLRFVLGSGAYVEGWAVYAADMMVEAGYRDHDPRLALEARKLELRGVINAILDIRLHTRELSDADAIELLMRQGFQERAEAELKLTRAKLSVTQLCSYFVGGEAWKLLRRSTRLPARELHDRALAAGPVPLPWLKAILDAP